MIIKYLKDKLGYILIILLVSIIFSTLGFMYGIPIDGVLYGDILTFFILVFFSISDFIHYRKKQIYLQQMSENVANTIVLPTAKSYEEKNYQAIIYSLQNQIETYINNTNSLNLEMKDFYALWVHQIKTPISAISIMVQQSEATNSMAIRAELFKIEQYTEQVLNFLRLEDISADLSLSVYNIGNIIRQTVKKFASIFISKKISIDLKNIDISVLTDEKWLSFSIEQLLSNALKYTNVGGMIKIFTYNQTTLMIEDNGIGILPEDLPRIFEKGFTGYNGRMDKKATGIGLYLTKKALDKLGHKIDIVSDNLSGTTVKIDLSRNTIHYE